MQAVTIQGKNKVKIKKMKAPEIQEDTDMIIKVTSTAICGSDLHPYRKSMPITNDYIIGHEPMGIVEEVGPGVKNHKVGDRIVISFNVSCGECHFCQNEYEMVKHNKIDPTDIITHNVPLKKAEKM